MTGYRHRRRCPLDGQAFKAFVLAAGKNDSHCTHAQTPPSVLISVAPPGNTPFG